MLRKVSTLLGQGKVVPVKLVPEPSNQFDSMAIMFQCKVDNNVHKIGYVDNVHTALKHHKIITIKFAWVK